MSTEDTRPEGWPWKPDKVWGLRSHPASPWRLTEPELFALWSRLYSGEDGDPMTIEYIYRLLPPSDARARYRAGKTAVRLLRKARFMSHYRLGRVATYTARKPTDDYWRRA